eukprot:511403-Amphidinium_carterae.1
MPSSAHSSKRKGSTDDSPAPKKAKVSDMDTTGDFILHERQYIDMLRTLVQRADRGDCKLSRGKLLVGSDCAGLGTTVPTIHAWAGEVDDAARRFLVHNHPDLLVLHGDVKKTKQKSYTDIYTSGFPCQPFSTAGLQLGYGDLHGRGDVFLYNLRYIQDERPGIFILENVLGLTQRRFEAEFHGLLSFLRGLPDEHGRAEYHITHDFVDSLDHGLAQHRKRVYIVGTAHCKK